MAKKFDYVKEIKLKHNEIPAKINIETGEVIEIKQRKSAIPDDKELWQAKVPFTKNYNKVIDWLEEEKICTDLELRVLWKLMRMAKYETNSLEPLNDDYAIGQIAEEFNINRNKVTPLLKKFYNLGIYARFDVRKVYVPYTKYWILNPYLCFSGRLIDSDIAKLFDGTLIQIMFNEFYAT